jgi:hypothetical protein
MRIDVPATPTEEFWYGKNTPIYRFEHRFPDRSPEDIFWGIEDWLTKERARIRRSSYLSSISAVHGTWLTMKGWSRNAKKKMFIRVRDHGSAVEVLIDLEPSALYSGDVLAQQEIAGANWEELAVDLWRHLGDSSAAPTEKVDWSGILETGRIMVRFGCGIAAIGLAIAVLANLAPGILQGPLTSTGAVVAGAGTTMALYGAIKKSEAKERLERRRRARLRLDDGDAGRKALK